VASDEIKRRWVHRFDGDLRLLDLTGILLNRMAGHADLAGTSNYDITQQWSLAVFQNPLMFDGFIFMSRHLNSDRAVALFDRAAGKLKHRGMSLSLVAAPELPAAIAAFDIVPA